MRMGFRWACLLTIYLYSHGLYAQDRRYNVVHYNTDNGLPQNSITGIQFDRKGYCWLGTQMGLVRFDGQRFSLFSSDNIKGLRSDRISNITRDTAGSVFVYTGGIVNVLKINDTLPSGASVPVLLQRSGYDLPMRGFVVSAPYPRSVKLAPDNQTVLGTKSGNRYLTQRTGSFYITADKAIPVYCRDGWTLLVDDHLVSIQAHNKVAVWKQGVIQPVMKLQGTLWTNPDFIKGNFTIPINTESGFIYAGRTLYQLTLGHDTLYSKVILDLEIPAVSSVYIDKPNNRFYIGSSVAGLFIVTPTDFYTPPAPGPAIGLDFYSQSVTDEGIFCQRFLFRRDGTSIEYAIPKNLKATWYQPHTRSLYYAPGPDLLRLNLKTGKPYTVTTLSSELSSIFPDPGHSDDILFSTSFSIGRIIHDTIRNEKNISGLTKDQALFAAYPAGTDTFLLATWGGVKWYDYAHNRIYRSILDSLAVRQLYIASPDLIWIASYGKGWYLYNKGRIIRMPDGPQEALKTVNAIIDDGRGYFWLSSNNGLFKVSKRALIDYAENRLETVYFYAFTTQDHLPTNEFNACNPSYVWLPDSMLSLPSIKGLVWFYPHKVNLSLPDKGIYIEHIRINQTEIAQTANGLVLAPDHGRLILKVSSPYFGNKENMQLQFRIEGLDEEWHAVSENGEIFIDRMPAGAYSLVIRKVTGMKPGEYIRLVLPVRVLPYWYNTRLFYLVVLLLSAMFVYWLVKLRTRLLHARNRKLTTQVALQTRDLHRMVHQLTRSEEALKQSNQTKDNIITTVLHDLRSPIRFIYTISKHIASGHNKMQEEALDKHLQELKNSTASLNSFTDQFFTWAISQHRTFAATYSMEALADIFVETESLYTDIMSANGNRLIVMPTMLYCHTDPQLLSAIIRNLLDNANKNTSNGIIKLEAIRTDNKVVITVSDTGRGFMPAALKAFLNKDKTDSRGGRGSFIILHLLELINGDLEADSEQGKGTEFRITLFHQDSAHGNTPAG